MKNILSANILYVEHFIFPQIISIFFNSFFILSTRLVAFSPLCLILRHSFHPLSVFIFLSLLNVFSSIELSARFFFSLPSYRFPVSFSARFIRGSFYVYISNSTLRSKGSWRAFMSRMCLSRHVTKVSRTVLKKKTEQNHFLNYTLKLYIAFSGI